MNLESIYEDIYEVSQIGNIRKNCDIFSCENDHLKCKTKCELGIHMTKSIYDGKYDIVGA